MIVENSVNAAQREAALQKLGAAYTGVARAQRRLRGRDAMQPGRLTAPQVNLLQPLAESGPMSSGQLAEAAGLTPATTTHMLDQLAVAGVVERKRQENDKRVVITRLTEEGERLLSERVAEIGLAWAAALERFDAEHLDNAADVVEAICRFVDDL
jgi:DNA-binding MarR family transcriptional regulator